MLLNARLSPATFIKLRKGRFCKFLVTNRSVIAVKNNKALQITVLRKVKIKQNAGGTC